MCRATLGAIPVWRWTWAASVTFSKALRGTPGWPNTLKRVPELPKAQDGSSMRWVARAAFTPCRSVVMFLLLGPSAGIPWGSPPSTRTSSPVVTSSGPLVRASTASATCSGRISRLSSVRWA